MRKFTADFIVNPKGDLLPNMVLELQDSGEIIQLREKQKNETDLEEFKGILSPGFINCHCHMELSFMFEQIPTHTGLVDFVKHVVAIRDNFSEEQQQAAIQSAYQEMTQNGIKAVGDISNDPRSFQVKSNSKIPFHTFVESFDLGPANTEAAFQSALETFLKVPHTNGSKASIVPHAPYSVTPELFQRIAEHCSKNGNIFSIHMQEQRDENAMFIDFTGVWPSLFSGWDIPTDWFKPTGKNSLESVMEPVKDISNKWLFIHNTNSTPDDIQWAHQNNSNVFWCFCPNANLYIENALPRYEYFLQNDAKCVLGTDSLASNWQLSILSEMQAIEEHSDAVSAKHLFQWATVNGAECLDFDKLGSFEPNKVPGVLLIEHCKKLSGNNTKIGKEASVKVIY